MKVSIEDVRTSIEARTRESRSLETRLFSGWSRISSPEG
jgi:hypothetical protein